MLVSQENQQEAAKRIVRIFLRETNKNLTPRAVSLIITMAKIRNAKIEDILFELIEEVSKRKINKVILDDTDLIQLSQKISNAKIISEAKSTRSYRDRKRKMAKYDLEAFLGISKSEKNNQLAARGSVEKKIRMVENISRPPTSKSDNLETMKTPVQRTSRIQSAASLDHESVQKAVQEIKREIVGQIEYERMEKEETPSVEVSLPVKSKINIIYTPSQIVFNESYEAFRDMFYDRFARIRKILIKKGLTGLQTSNGINKGDSEQDKHIIILVYEKRYTKNGKGGIITGEDEDGFISIYVPFRNGLKEKFDRVLKDTVLAIKFRRKNNSYLIAEDIIFPGLQSEGKRNRSPTPFKVAFISDTHFGSKQFMEKSFQNFIKFINGDIEKPWVKKVTKNLGALVIVGDLVDGIGVYPNQQEELSIIDIYEQFNLAKRYLEQIKDEIEIIIIPGNHDPAGKFIPQPPIPKEFIGDLLGTLNLRVLGNPSLITINGVKILLYHGQGLEDIASDLNMGIKRPTLMMVEQLRNRHILPMWGEEPIIPMKQDPFVIEEMPDIYVAGHLHMIDVWKTTTGTLLINSSTFEGLTSWQKKLGIKPTPGVFPIVDLKTFDVTIIRCDDRTCEIVGG